jgi:hypothetical protein
MALVHGEAQAQDVLAGRLRRELQRDVITPARGESISF